MCSFLYPNLLIERGSKNKNTINDNKSRPDCSRGGIFTTRHNAFLLLFLVKYGLPLIFRHLHCIKNSIFQKRS